MIAREELLRLKRIASRASPKVKNWAALADRKGREEQNLTLAEGAKLTGEGLEATANSRFRPETLLIADSGADRPEAAALFARAGELGIERISLADDCFAKLSGLRNGDGLALVLKTADATLELNELWNAPNARWLVAAEVQDPGNAGALARTALAAGFDGCLFLGGADPLSPKFLRGCMGAAFRLPCLNADADAFAAAWRNVSGGRLVAATARESATHYRRADFTPPLALLVGGERGIPEPLLSLPHEAVHIPLKGGVESLNLAVAAGVILFEAAKD